MATDPARPDLALSFDMIAPEGYGEIIGGGERQSNYDTLLKRIREQQSAGGSFSVVSRPAPLRQRPACGLRPGPGAHRGLDLRNRAHPRSDPLPTHALSRLSLSAAASANRGAAEQHANMAEKIRIIGVPMDLGASRRGVDMGPSALARRRSANAAEAAWADTVEDIGNITVKQPEEQHYGEKRANISTEIAETCKGLAETVQKDAGRRTCAAGSRRRPFHRGGNHRGRGRSLSQGVEAHRHDLAGRAWRHEHAGIVRLRATFMACRWRRIMGYGPPELVDLVGIQAEGRAAQCGAGRRARSGFARERSSSRNRASHVFTMRDIDERGMREVMADALRFAMRRYRRHRRQPGYGLRRSLRRPGRGHAGARRRHLSRGAPGAGNDCR